MTQQRPFLRRGPSGPLAEAIGAIIQQGYDINIEPVNIGPPDETHVFIPRDNAGNPLQVTFPTFTIGNILEVDFRLCGAWTSDSSDQLQFSPEVSLDGGVTFYRLFPAGMEDLIGAGAPFTVAAKGAIKIVNPMPIVTSGIPGTIDVTAPPIVRCAFSWVQAAAVSVGGALTLNQTGLMLKATEVDVASVFQNPDGAEIWTT